MNNESYDKSIVTIATFCLAFSFFLFSIFSLSNIIEGSFALKTQKITHVKSEYTKYDGESFKISPKAKTNLSYKSSKTSVVTVSSEGKITCKSPGTAYITITASASKEKGYQSAKKKIKIVVKKNYLRLAKNYSDRVYKIAKGNIHESTKSKCSALKDIKNGVINCNCYVSVVLQEAGIIKGGAYVGHTDSSSKKNFSPTSVIKGYNSYIKNNSNLKVVKVGKKYNSMSSAYKKKGYIYIYDSNAAINAGGGKIYSFNAASGKRENHPLKSNSGNEYSFNSMIYYVLIPVGK